ncbi:hypothetical protein [Nocardia araoensis]|uniref:hypothetical protein n=1 Tax=Nocardia araoensis TaxID=228600 RepID=UPI000584B3FC|nr:hypothetical protein [Nocardia araoensis]
MVLDTRHAPSTCWNPLAGSVNIPLREFENRLADILENQRLDLWIDPGRTRILFKSVGQQWC